MRKDGYVVVQPWMVTDYNLNGNKLLIYALIWGFSQDDQSCFYGSVSYIVDYFKLSKRAVLNLLGELEKDGLIRKWSETETADPQTGMQRFARQSVRLRLMGAKVH